MDNIFLIALIISFIFLIVKFLEMRFITKENKSLKSTLIDTIFVMIRRISHGESPFTPDRSHLHHFFILYGFSDRQTLGIILVMSITMASIGISMEINDLPERYMFIIFVLISFIYLFPLRHAWRLLNVK